MTLAVIASILSTILLWGVLFAFGFWAYRKFHFRSIPWAAAFLVLTLTLSISAKWSGHYFATQHPEQIMNMAQFMNVAQFFGYTGTLGNLFAFFSYLGVFISNLAYLILALLILSDIATLFLRSGIDVKDRFGQQLISLGSKSTVFGIVMVILKIVPTASYIIIFNFG